MTLSLDTCRRTADLATVRPQAEDPACLLSLDECGLTYDYFTYLRGEADLAVLLPSALERGKRFVPAFHRWSWAPRLPGVDVVCVSDPTLRLDEHMLGGWFQGRADDWALPRALAHLRTLFLAGGYRRVVFCGSSLGGFVALQAGVLALEAGWRDEEVRILAENPQVDLRRYIWTAHMNRLAQASFGCASLSDIAASLVERIDVVSLVAARGRAPHGLVVVKDSDEHHLTEHFLPLQVALAGHPQTAFERIPAASDPTGHTPLAFEAMTQRLAALRAA